MRTRPSSSAEGKAGSGGVCAPGHPAARSRPSLSLLTLAKPEHAGGAVEPSPGLALGTVKRPWPAWGPFLQAVLWKPGRGRSRRGLGPPLGSQVACVRIPAHDFLEIRPWVSVLSSLRIKFSLLKNIFL